MGNSESLNNADQDNSSDSSDDSDYEGLNEPPIRRQLQNILRQYPDGPQIIRELVQNAEDAEATVFKVMLCTEDNVGHGDFNIKYKEILEGPGLCVFNDSVFKEQDWKGIKSIYTSIKETETLKIGRFGLGFKSVFHLTDTPVIVSGDRLLIINPTEKPGRVCHNVSLTKLTSTYRNTLCPVLKQIFKMDKGGTFGFDDSCLEENYFSGTLFWFPLRKVPSLLLDKIYSPMKMKELMDSFQKEMDVILLFLQNVNKITIMESEKNVLYEVTIKQTVSAHENTPDLRHFIQNKLKELRTTKPENSIVASFNVELTIYSAKRREKKDVSYKIVNFYQGRGTMSPNLKKLTKNSDNVPFVGVAYPLKMEDSFIAHVFCFLPLPLTSSSLTNLPVHVNGFFNLDPSRDHVLQATAGQVGQRDKNIEWNELLIKEVIPEAYSKLVKDLIDEKRTPNEVYGSLPDVRKVTADLWSLLLPTVFRRVFLMDVFQTERPDRNSVKLKNAVFDIFDEKERKAGEEIKNAVIYSVKKYNENLVLLPEHLKALIVSWEEYNIMPEESPKLITVEYVAGLLQADSRYKRFSRETKISLLKYFLKYGSSESHKGFELIPTNHGNHFVSLKSTDPLYLCPDKIADLFPMLEKQLISKLSDEVKDKLLNQKAEIMKLWTMSDFRCLLEQSIKAQDSTLLQHDVSLWIRKVWSFLSKHQHLIQQVETFKILFAEEDGKSHPSLHVLKDNNILCKAHGLSPLPSEVKEILKCCGVKQFQKVCFLQDEVLEKYVEQPTVEGVCRVLQNSLCRNETYISKINRLPVKVRKQFAVFIGQESSKTIIEFTFLRRLALFPLSNAPDAFTGLCSVDEVAGIEPQNLKKFPVKYCRRLLDSSFMGIHLAVMLDCREFDKERLIKETLQKAHNDGMYSYDEVISFMKYFMNNLEDDSPEDQIELAAGIRFIENGLNEVKAPKDLFDPSVHELRDLFMGEEKVYFPKELEDWNLIGKWKRLKIKSIKDITANDLINTVRNVQDENLKLNNFCLGRKVNAILRFATDLEQDGYKTFIENVTEIKWIPVVNSKLDPYPELMRWKGENVRVCKPNEAYLQKFQQLVGSVSFLSDCNDQALLKIILKEPSTQLVLEQLKHLSDVYKTSRKSMQCTMMLSEIFKFLGSKSLTKAELDILHQEYIIPTASSLTKSMNVFINFLPDTHQISLEPYLFKLSEEWTNQQDMGQFFVRIGCKETLSLEDLLLIQRKIKEYHSPLERRSKNDIERDLHNITEILDILKEKNDELSQEQRFRILFPVHSRTNHLNLMFARECTHTDEKHIELMEVEEKQDEEFAELYFVHENIKSSVAECFGVPSLSRRVMESGGIEDLEYEQWGQEEPLTTRIKNILNDYSDGALFKEMLQNADDAGASCMKILYDERRNDDARTGLIDKGMEECQGPSLWFYNNAKFQEKDFRNIIKLGGGTKKSDPSKIGKFGFGFCSVYSVTDVPTILSGKYIVIFDPRTIHLGKAIKDKSKPGLKIPISKIANKFRKQFKPFHKIFMCNFSEEGKEEEYDGTLFRLPLRTVKQAEEDPNGISTKAYGRREVMIMIRNFMQSAGNLLLFTQNVTKIQLYFLAQSDGPENCKCLFSIEKKVEKQVSNIFDCLQQTADKGNTELCLTFQFDVHTDLDQEKLRSLLGTELPPEEHKASTSKWITTWAASNISDDIQTPVLLACTAMPLSFSLGNTGTNDIPYGFYNTGHVFCFLPLPQENQMQVHLNGNFAVEQNRKSIVFPSPSSMIEPEEGAKRNHSIMSTVLTKAYLKMLENVDQYFKISDYHTTWPTSWEGNVFNPLVSKFYANICQNDFKVFFIGGNLKQKFSFKDCIFLDSTLQNDPKVGETAYQCLVKFNPFSRRVLFMPRKIEEEFINASCELFLQEQICNEESFFINVFLKNLGANFWGLDRRQEIRRCLLKRIFDRGNETVLMEMRDIECIPTKPRGNLRKPSELVDQFSHAVSDMFCETDERFPEDKLSDVREQLVRLGMITDILPDNMLLERLNTIQQLSNIEMAKKRCKALMRYIDQHKLPKGIVEQVSNIPFLPVMGKPDDWPCSWFLSDGCHFAAPNALYRSSCKFLIGSAQKVLDDSVLKEFSNECLCNLNIKNSSDVTGECVLKQLKEITAIGKDLISNDKAYNLKKICNDVYKYLNHSSALRDLNGFSNLPCIIIQDNAMSVRLIEPNRTSLYSDDARPFIYKVDKNYVIYENFLLNVGVHSKVDQNLLMETLKGIPMIEGERVENLHSVVKLYNLINDTANFLTSNMLLPDNKGIMQRAENMCYEDGNDKISACNLIVTHSDLRISVCKKFQVISKSAKFIKKYSIGVSFGQKEKLVTRLNHILKDYPCDISILNELLQNADDAKATQMHFIHDKRQHSKKELFDESMKCLQGPALVVYNDSCFSQKDIEGISNLGEGSKSDDPDQTGQFGIGFNAVYRITDVPSLLSKGERTPDGGTLIMFDPHCRYVPGATPENPGIKVENLMRIKENYSSVYNTYLQDELPASTGTWFRFPLRTKEMAKYSSIRKDEVIDENQMMKILNSFQSEMSNSLLFLRNVRCIKLSEINDNGELCTVCELTSTLREQRSETRDFSSKCKKELNLLRKGVTVLGEHPGFACSYCIDLKISSKGSDWSEKWAVTSVFGTKNQISVKDVLRDGYKQDKINLLPRGGIAACLSETKYEIEDESNDNENSDENPDEKSQSMRAFCSLPLPLPTGLPVHINGHFSLDSNRTNIWTEDKSSLKGSWNEFILNEVLPFAYITSLQFLQEIIFSDFESLSVEDIRKYNSYFPLVKDTKNQIWKNVVEKVYSKILLEGIAVFPMLLDKDTFESVKSSSCIVPDGIRLGEKKSAVVFIAWKPQNHYFPAYFNSMGRTSRDQKNISADISNYSSQVPISEEKKNRNTEEVFNILKRLGLKLLESSLDILDSILASFTGKERYLPKAIEVSDILHFLQSWNSNHLDKCKMDNIPREIENTLFKSVRSVEMLLSFCHENRKTSIDLEGIPLCALEDGSLTYFSKSLPKLVSKYCHLFENSKNQFVSRSLVPIMDLIWKEDKLCLRKLSVAQCAELLQDTIPNFYRQEPVLWKTMDIGEQWIGDFWNCLSSIGGNVAEDCKIYLSDWCLVPVEDRKGQSYLYPFKLAYAILDTCNFEDKDVLQVLMEIGFPRFANKEKSSRWKLSHLFASESTPENILSMFCYHKDMYSGTITSKSANIMLSYLLAKLHSLVKKKDNATLNNFRSAYLFETLDGCVTNLPENRPAVCLKDEDFPTCGLSDLRNKQKLVLLVRKEFINNFDVISMSQEDFYVDVFLKQTNLMDSAAVKKHMEHIRDKRLWDSKRSKEMKILLSEIAWIQNDVTGKFEKVGDFYTPHVTICKLLCSRQDLLPSEFQGNEWKGFLDFIGLKTDVPYSLLLKFGRQIEGFTIYDKDLKQKSEVLLKYIFKQKCTEEMKRVQFMRQFRNIECVEPFQVPKKYRDILSQQSHGALVCFQGSVLSSTWEIVWSKCNIISENTINQEDLDILGIKSKPDVSDVVGHIHTLCCLLQEHKSQNWCDLMTGVYEKLEKYIQSNKTVTEEIKQGLIETPFLYDASTNKFLHSYEVALLADSEKLIENCIYRGPEQYAVFNDLFRKIGVFDQPNFYHYLRLFHTLHQRTSASRMTPEEMHIAEKAFQGLLRCENLSNVSQLPHLVDLYLPSENDKLSLSKEIVFCDRPSLKRRLPEYYPIDYVKNCRVDMKQLKNLPEQFRPKILSEILTEFDQIGPDCENDADISRLKKLFQSDAFIDGIWRYIKLSSGTSISKVQKERTKLKLHSVRIQKVSLLRTVLKDSNGSINSTLKDKSIYYKTSKERIEIYITSTTKPFEKCFDVWKSKLCQVVCLCAEGLLHNDDHGFIQELLQSKSDGDVLEICKKYEIELDSTNWQPSPGTSLPLEFHNLLDNAFCRFEEGELAVFERIDPFSDCDENDEIKVFESEFIYVRIMKKDQTSQSEPLETFPVYIVFDGEAEISVSTIRLFKLVRKPEEQSNELVLFSRERIQVKRITFSTIQADIERMLISAWKLSRSDRRSVIKRLLLLWHPDKNKNNDFAKEVTQFILDVINKLETTGSERYSSGYSAGNSHHYGTTQNWRIFQQNVKKCSEKRHFYSENYSYYSSYSTAPRKPNPQPAVAQKWIKQAKYDFIAACEQQESLKNTASSKSWNWICYKAHQSCEKAMKAALYYQDADRAAGYQFSHDLPSLSSALPEQIAVAEYISSFSREITTRHTSLRYPDGGHLPGDRFTQQQADKAVDIAKHVLNECENCFT